MKTFVVTDIHGCLGGLSDALLRAGFDLDEDRLICIGDTCDGWPEVAGCFRVLLGIRNLVYLPGNHDMWALDHYNGHLLKKELVEWLKQGGRHTVRSFDAWEKEHGEDGMLDRAMDLIQTAYKKPYLIDDRNRLFVHGDLDPTLPMDKQDPKNLIWGRGIIETYAFHRRHTGTSWPIPGYSEVFLGHTPTIQGCLGGKAVPINFCNVWAMDTGAGFMGGRVTVMDITGEPGEYRCFHGDFSESYYPGHSPRG